MEIIKPDFPLIVRPDDIVRIARSYIGETELPNNSGFKDPAFQKKMQIVGWLKGQSWCVYTAELIWKEGFTTAHKYYDTINHLFTGGAVATWYNYKAAPEFKTGNMPKLGALALYQHGSTWQGHAGVVVSVDQKNKKMHTNVEGNTNDKGGREGYIVAEKARNAGAAFSLTGLNLLGFVYLPE